jgi:hypothetical protein
MSGEKLLKIRLIKTEDFGQGVKLEAIVSETSAPINQSAFDRGYARGLQGLRCEESYNKSYMSGYFAGTINRELESLQKDIPVNFFRDTKTKGEK